MTLISKNQNTLSKNLIFSILTVIIIGIVNVLYPVIIGLIFGPEIMGNFSLILYWILLLNIPISNGIAPAISRFIATSSDDLGKKPEIIGIKITIYYFLFITVLYPILGFTILNLNIIEIVIVLVALGSIIFHYLFRKTIQGKENFSYLFKIELISFLLFIPLMLVFGILPKYLGWNLLTNNYYTIFIPIILYHLFFDILISIKYIKKLHLKRFFSLPTETKDILVYASFIGLGVLFSLGISHFNVIISKNYLDNFELGVLGFWNSAVSVISIITVALGSVLLPRITNLRNTEDDLAKSLTNKVNWIITLIVIPLAGLFFIIFTQYPEILDVITLNKYNMQIYWLVAILLCFKELNVLLADPTLSYMLSSEKHVRFYPISSFIYTISAIISWILLVPKFGLIGFAGSLAIGSFIYLLVNYIYTFIIAKRKIGLNFTLLIAFYLLNIGAIVALQYWSNAVFIIIWSVLTLVSLIFGIYKSIKLIKNKNFSYRYFKVINETSERDEDKISNNALNK